MLTLVVAFFVNHKKIKTSGFIIGLMIIALGIRFGLVFSYNSDPASDFFYMYSKAKELVAGNQDTLKTSYFNLFPFKAPPYDALVLKFFKSTLALKILNAIYSTLIVSLFIDWHERYSTKKQGGLPVLLLAFFRLLLCIT